MFDLFGMSKVDAKDSIREMMHGCTTGILDSFWWKLEQKDEQIKDLQKEIAKLNEKIELLTKGEKDDVTKG